ncbi:MAG TPA: alpha/beta fold hydrolase [Halalkalibaculum sp.]|nr:alpha/beta fold hydrolase [Halalkalibaculum sp.]
MRKLILILIALLIPWLNSYSQNITQAEGRLIPVNGTELYVKAIGSGEPVIVVHGGPVLDHSYLYHHLEPLSKDYRLIFFDQRLSGRSSADIDSADISLNAFIEDIEALRKELNFGKVHILGHSWGGLLAMKYAIRYPDHVIKLMLINSMAPTSKLWQKEVAVLASSSSRADSLQRQKIMQSRNFRENKPQAIEKLLELSFKNQFYDPENAALLDLFVPEDYMKRSRLFGNLMPYLSSYDLTDELRKLNIPTLIMYGRAEPAADISGPVLNRLITNATFTLIDESGHFPFIEQPMKFRETVSNFINDPK